MRDVQPSIPRISVSVDEARQIVLACLPAARIEQRPIHSSVGMVLAEEVRANLDSPAFNTSAMDGFAVRSDDVQELNFPHTLSLKIKGTLVAGQRHKAVARRGTTYRIMTGGRMPQNADAVVPQELARVDGDRLLLSKPIPSGANVRTAGSETARGDRILAPGRVFDGIELALMHAQLIDQITVFDRPTVAVIATGDEISPMSTVDGASTDANTWMLHHKCLQWGATVASGRAVPDSVKLLNQEIFEARAKSVDLIITTGGASTGDRDVVSDLIRTGALLTAYDVRMKPGRPLIVGRIGETPFIGLPGNPVAAFVSAMQFVRPAIRHLSGHSPEIRPLTKATLPVDIPNSGMRTNFVRVALESDGTGLVARPFPRQTAADLATLANADALLIIPEECELARAGERFEIQLL